nr:serine protease inhibitor 2.1-like isoform X2 [Geotrypetes seraphini]XP_033807053.1 serine protease inhibitor 2.1-like isoform X2 [Geotrypetes seraphini]XP_033807054.1 serine protease inhibitor 2.1-like isoform X2 [Geotrypetes seraphini]XP_033807055.1 serine protease inhibitor 2.1-like isoform X2 [Geotrypetes seraphini]XP_033807056.1 serine protease inhibitor 2.1-like isoform X2 [Geotrypetes seraphini]XP_033807058.1 serine protease inhibitor 2.1-like isoform X2 [Geotrypetes seraphini]
MQFALCLCILVLCAGVQADHHKDHEDISQHYHDDADDDHNDVTCQKIVSVNCDFTFRIYQELLASSSSNILFSPVGIFTALSMLALGAKDETNIEIIETLGFNYSQHTDKEIHRCTQYMIQKLTEPISDLKLEMSNALFVSKEYKLLSVYMEEMHKYKADEFTTDFSNTVEATKQINEYVTEKIHGITGDIVSDLDPRTVILLVNCLFLQAQWEHTFNPDLTREGNFHVDENTDVKVPMMFQIGMLDIYNDDELNCTVVRLPYKGNASVLLVLPGIKNMKEVEAALTQSTIKKWKSKLYKTNVALKFPKFILPSSLDLKPILMKMGMKKVFTDGADLTGLTGQPDLKVSTALHKAMIDVNETGTMAAAVTVVQIMPISVPRSVGFDHPFIMLIFDHKGTCLFMGKIVNPTE